MEPAGPADPSQAWCDEPLLASPKVSHPWVHLWRRGWEGIREIAKEAPRTSTHALQQAKNLGTLLAMINKAGHIPVSEKRCRSSRGEPLPCPPRSLSSQTTTGSYQRRRLCWVQVTSGHSVLPRSLEPSRQFTVLSLLHAAFSHAQFFPLNLAFWFLNKRPLRFLWDLDEWPFYWYSGSLFKILAGYRISSVCFYPFFGR